MKIWPCVATLVAGLLWAGGFRPVSAQQTNGETRVLANLEWGTAAGLGYKLPHILVGMTLEKPIKTRWEAQGGVFYSPDRKYLTNDGNTVQVAGTLVFWPIQRIGLTGELGYTHLWTAAFEKSAWQPAAGVVIRDSLAGARGRVYLAYVFPTGCQWGAECPLQSSRLHGVQGYEEFQPWTHWRFGIRAAWWRFADQSNELRPDLGRIWHNTGTLSMVVRYKFRARDLNEEY